MVFYKGQERDHLVSTRNLIPNGETKTLYENTRSAPTSSTYPGEHIYMIYVELTSDGYYCFLDKRRMDGLDDVGVLIDRAQVRLVTAPLAVLPGEERIRLLSDLIDDKATTGHSKFDKFPMALQQEALEVFKDTILVDSFFRVR